MRPPMTARHRAARRRSRARGCAPFSRTYARRSRASCGPGRMALAASKLPGACRRYCVPLRPRRDACRERHHRFPPRDGTEVSTSRLPGRVPRQGGSVRHQKPVQRRAVTGRQCAVIAAKPASMALLRLIVGKRSAGAEQVCPALDNSRCHLCCDEVTPPPNSRFLRQADLLMNTTAR